MSEIVLNIKKKISKSKNRDRGYSGNIFWRRKDEKNEECWKKYRINVKLQLKISNVY